MKAAGARVLRGGAFKPRTSPYSFPGLKADGLRLLALARAETGLPVVTEVMDARHLELVAEHARTSCRWARATCRTSRCSRKSARCRMPVLLKRGMSATIAEYLQAAEYVMKGGNEQVILCERGIRTFEPSTRNTLDLNAVPMLKRHTHLPVHRRSEPRDRPGVDGAAMACAAVAAGADGLLIEVHGDPARALSDGAQALTLEEFA